MASLVADYGSDEDNSDSDDVGDDTAEKTSPKQQEIKNFLITEDSSSSDSNDSENEANKRSVDSSANFPNPLQDKLPAPSIGNDSHNDAVTSVFSNPFVKAEIAKNSVLEQHVRMTEKQPERGVKKICWKFKKGKCRMGKNCRYFHDQESIIGVTVDQEGQGDGDVYGQNELFNSDHLINKQALITEPIDDDNYMAGKKRKGRVGVSNNLQPTKRAMSSLSKQRESERPWTVSKK